MISIHGHRGSRGTHPENTIPAFEEAVAAGADVLELDLQLSRDTIPVVSHEPLIEPTLFRLRTGHQSLHSPIPIRQLTVSQIAEFECGHVRNPKFPEQTLAPGTKIPTLDELLHWASQLTRRIEFNIETKMTAPDPSLVAPPEEFVTAIIACLKSHGVVDRVILQSFDFRTLEIARKLSPNLRLSCLFETEEDFCELTQQQQAQFASPNHRWVTPQNVAQCHQHGIAVVPWTANTQREWARLKEAQVDAIITDYPRKLRVYLER